MGKRLHWSRRINYVTTTKKNIKIRLTSYIYCSSLKLKSDNTLFTDASPVNFTKMRSSFRSNTYKYIGDWIYKFRKY